MLQRIEVKPNTYARYKAENEFIPAGIYYKTNARLNTNERLKKGLRSVAAQDEKGQFCWLLPYEQWVKRVTEGFTPPEFRLYGNDYCETGVREFFDLTPALWSQLRTWQKQSLADIVACAGKTGGYARSQIARIGAGKTLFGLCVLNSAEKPVAVAPSYLHRGWKEEAIKWGLKMPHITTYESAHHVTGGCDRVVFDESLALKNPHAVRHQKALKLRETAAIAIGFTGSESSVSPMDLRWLNVVSPGCLPNDEVAWRFLWGLDTELKEVAPERKVYVTKTWNHKAIAEFAAPYVGIVDPNAIAAELPEVEYRRVYTPRPARFDMILGGMGTEGGVSKRLSQARTLSDGFFYDDLGTPVEMDSHKLDALAEIVENNDEPIVIWGAWSETVRRAAEKFKAESPAVLTGETGDYGEEIERFRSGSTRLLIANARIAFGMNLQRAKLMVFVSNCMYPVLREQAVGRIARPGQKAKGVVVIDLLATGTLDERQLELLTTHKGESEAFIEHRLREEMRRLK